MIYSRRIREFRVRDVPDMDSPEVEVRYGILTCNKIFRWDLFGLFNTKTVVWDCWHKAPDNLRDEALYRKRK